MPAARCILPIPADNGADEPSGVDSTQYIVSNNNRWSRITLNFEGLDSDGWFDLSFQLDWNPQEENRAVYDFAAIGFDFLMEDGSSVDFAYVPGLTRNQIDPHSWYIGGPDCNGSHNGPAQPGKVSCTFFVPSPTRKLAISVRSWRNSHPFTIRDPKLFQTACPASLQDSGLNEADRAHQTSAPESFNARRAWRTLTAEPVWYKYAVRPEHQLLVRGQIINENPGGEGALARIVYRNAKGEELPPPYPDIAVAPSIGAFIDIPIHRQARRFTLDLVPPPGAASIEIGFQTWHAEPRMELVVPLEVSLGDELLLENISGDDLPDARAFVHQALAKLGLELPFGGSQVNSAIFKQCVDPEALRSPFTFHHKLKSVQWGARTTFNADELVLSNFPSWRLPEAPKWMEDPFHSLAWRLEFQSLSWLVDVANGTEAGGLTRATDLAVSWSRANPWGHAQDPISAHPLSLSARTEALLTLLSLSAGSQQSAAFEKSFILFSEIVRHAFALAQLVSQNVFAHSVVHIHAACALLSAARALPKFPLASYWSSVALPQIQEGFDRLIDREGGFVEQSLHFRLETVSLGLILARMLGDMPETREFHDELIARLRKGLQSIVSATDPSGSLPPFGDAPQGYHHASWLRRLLSVYGTTLLSDPALAAALSYPTGKKVFSLPNAGLITARHYERNAHWSYFCASLNGHHSEHGHSDCTSFVYSAGGASWIVDPKGSDFYEAGSARQYLVSARAHNLAIPDEREPTAGTAWIEAHETLEGANLFQIGTNVHGHDYDHRRIIVCLDNLHAVALFDHFTTQARPVSFEGLLHFDPKVTAAIASSRLGIGYRKDGRLQIIPHVLKGQFSGMSIDNGRSDRPTALQGFVAQPTGGLQPASVLRYRFSGHGTVCGGVVLATSERSAGTLANLLKATAVKNLFQRLSTAVS
ncbi:heparinase II/III domain-containing protein [Microvirga vignae]|uniref:heparinase II/III domain-containing protein n=1 Tax=Microvirga vignae TaxID=1225564 RepID=UPI00069AD23F|nr:heparinase II/III family protein [Microvirga vignae]